MRSTEKGTYWITVDFMWFLRHLGIEIIDSPHIYAAKVSSWRRSIKQV